MRSTPKFERECKNCKCIFLVTKTMESSGKRVYCSRKCMADGYSKGHNPHIQKGRLERNCKNCNVIFQASRYYVLSGKGGNFCSRACRNKFVCTGKPLTESHKNNLIISAAKRDLNPNLRAIYRRAGLLGGVASQISQLRNGNMTSIEKLVNEFLIDQGFEFQSQMPLGYFVLDFYIPKHNLVIEADGLYWHNLPKAVTRDKRKNTYLKNRSYNLLRIPEDKINSGEFKSIILDKISEITKTENKHFFNYAY